MFGFDQEPTGIVLNQSELRTHYAMVMETGKVSLFPTSKKQSILLLCPNLLIWRAQQIGNQHECLPAEQTQFTLALLLSLAVALQ